MEKWRTLDDDEDYNSRCVVLCDKLEDSQSHLVQSSVHWHLRDSVTVPTNETLFPNGDNVVLGLNGAKNLLIWKVLKKWLLFIAVRLAFASVHVSNQFNPKLFVRWPFLMVLFLLSQLQKKWLGVAKNLGSLWSSHWHKIIFCCWSPWPTRECSQDQLNHY